MCVSVRARASVSTSTGLSLFPIRCNFISLCEISKRDNKIHSFHSINSRSRFFSFALVLVLTIFVVVRNALIFAFNCCCCCFSCFCFAKCMRTRNVLFIFAIVKLELKFRVRVCVCVWRSCNVSRFDHTSIEIHCVNIFLLSYFECDAYTASTHTLFGLRLSGGFCVTFCRRSRSCPLSLLLARFSLLFIAYCFIFVSLSLIHSICWLSIIFHDERIKEFVVIFLAKENISSQSVYECERGCGNTRI